MGWKWNWQERRVAGGGKAWNENVGVGVPQWQCLAWVLRESPSWRVVSGSILLPWGCWGAPLSRQGGARGCGRAEDIASSRMDLSCSEAAAGILRIGLSWEVSSSSSSRWFSVTPTLIHVDIEDFVGLLGSGQGLQRVLQIFPQLCKTRPVLGV